MEELNKNSCETCGRKGSSYCCGCCRHSGLPDNWVSADSPEATHCCNNCGRQGCRGRRSPSINPATYCCTMWEKIDKNTILELASRVFTDGVNNLILAVGYGERTSNYWTYYNYASPECNDLNFFNKPLMNIARFSSREQYTYGVKFVTDHTNPNVIALWNLITGHGFLDEDKLTLLCAQNEIGNEFWNAVVCVNASGDIVIHEVRDDGMISKERAVVKRFDEYAS